MNDDDGRVGDQFMDMIEPLAAERPYVTVLGNHESCSSNFSCYTQRFSNNQLAANSGNNWYRLVGLWGSAEGEF